MLRFIATHPGAFSFETLQPLAKEPMPEGVTWKATFVAFDDNRTFCHWEAPSMEDVLAIFAKYEIPYDAIYEVRLFDPVSGTMETATPERKVPEPV